MDRPQPDELQEIEDSPGSAPGDEAQLLSADRRRSHRYPAVDQRVWTAWWTNPEEFVATAAAVENISRGGAKIMMAEPPEVREKLWVRLANPVDEACLEATVLEVRRDETGSYCVRMVFASPCPQSFHSAVAEGIAQPENSDPRFEPGRQESASRPGRSVEIIRS